MSVRDFYFQIYLNGKASFYSERRLKLISRNHPENKCRGKAIQNLLPPLQKRYDYTPLDNQPKTGSIGGTARSRKS